MNRNPSSSDPRKRGRVRVHRRGKAPSVKREEEPQEQPEVKAKGTKRPLKIRTPAVIQDPAPSTLPPEKDDAEQAMMAQRAAMLQRAAEAHAAPPQPQPAAPTYTPVSAPASAPVAAPRRAKFVPRSQRKTVLEKEAMEEKARQDSALLDARVKERREESRGMVHGVLESERLAAEMAAMMDSEEELPDDSDDDEETERRQWVVRELSRMKRDEEKRIMSLRLMKEKEARANMTEEEWLASQSKEEEKPQMRYLQKYYHKGAFYQDGDLVRSDLLERDFTQATGQDRDVDRSLLPAMMQVRDFGKTSRSKYTHLAAEDTTNTQENPWREAEEWKKSQ